MSGTVLGSRNKSFIRPVSIGVIGALVLLGVYFSILALISGWPFTLDQFSQYWYFLVSLSLGFGIQLGSYSYLKQLIGRKDGSGKVVAVNGTTSTAAMISCCTHYLVHPADTRRDGNHSRSQRISSPVLLGWTGIQFIRHLLRRKPNPEVHT